MTSSRVSASGEPSRLQKLRHYTPTILVAVGVLVGWELLVRVFNIQKFLLPAPSVILNAMLNEIRLATTPGEGSILFQATLATLWSAFGGMCLGCGLGLAVALITARWTISSEAAMPFANHRFCPNHEQLVWDSTPGLENVHRGHHCLFPHDDQHSAGANPRRTAPTRIDAVLRGAPFHHTIPSAHPQRPALHFQRVARCQHFEYDRGCRCRVFWWTAGDAWGFYHPRSVKF